MNATIERPRIQEQLALLSEAKLPLGKWGRGPAKTVGELIVEIEKGDVVLSEDPTGKLRRTVRISQVVVTHGDKILVEKEQVYYDDKGVTRTRPRNRRRISEKATPEESSHQTALRGLGEELALFIGGERLQENGAINKIESSTTYPGIEDDKTIHRFGLELTDEEFDALQNERLFEVQDTKVVVFEWHPKAA